MKLSDISEKSKFNVTLLICVGIYLTHFINILKYAVNIPFWDEWEALTPTGILANPTLEQLFAQHNEHRIVTTKLLTLLLYKLDGWNIITHQAVNFVIFGFLLYLMVHLVEIYVPQLPVWILLCFIPFLLTTLNWENHFWGFQSQFHFSLLFLLISVWFLFNEEQSWTKLLLGIFFSWLTIYSLSSGLIEIVVVLICYICFKLIQIRRQVSKSQTIRQLIIGTLSVSSAIGLYFVGYVKPSHHPAITYPFQGKFWKYYFNLISSGFGNQSERQLEGILLSLFIIFPILGLIWKKRFELTNGNWVFIVSALAVLGALVSITMGRAGFDLSQSKASRYAEVVGILIPLSIGLWSLFLDGRRKIFNYIILVFWVFCFISFAQYWNFQKTYYNAAQQRIAGVGCIKKYYSDGGSGDCPMIYPLPIGDRLEFDKTLKLSFVKEAQR